jgi:hypothetical protein
MRVWVESLGIVGPGLPGWEVSRAVLAGQVPYPGGELTLPKLDLLPPVERRRTGTLVKLSLAAGQDALAQARAVEGHLPAVFAASGGDGDVINEICITLAGPDRQLSPTRFHNSVHNAPAGYWSIATGSRAASTSLSALDWSFAAGLVEAASQIVCEHDKLLLIAADMPYPQPLAGVRKTKLPFGGALLLARNQEAQSLAALDVDIEAAAQPTRMKEPGLEHLRTDNPSARSLPLFAALAAGKPATVVLDYVGGKSIGVTISPC